MLDGRILNSQIATVMHVPVIHADRPIITWHAYSDCTTARSRLNRTKIIHIGVYEMKK